MTTSTITQDTSSDRSISLPPPPAGATHVRVAVVAAAGFIVLATFQLALALGAPWGEAAYGGTRTNLPTGLRTASAVATIFYVLAALVVLRRGGYRVPLVGVRFARIGTWVLIGLLAVGAIANFASSGEWERFGWGPFTLILAVLCFVVARTRVVAPSASAR